MLSLSQPEDYSLFTHTLLMCFQLTSDLTEDLIFLTSVLALYNFSEISATEETRKWHWFRVNVIISDIPIIATVPDCDRSFVFNHLIYILVTSNLHTLFRKQSLIFIWEPRETIFVLTVLIMVDNNCVDKKNKDKVFFIAEHFLCIFCCYWANVTLLWATNWTIGQCMQRTCVT